MGAVQPQVLIHLLGTQYYRYLFLPELEEPPPSPSPASVLLLRASLVSAVHKRALAGQHTVCEAQGGQYAAARGRLPCVPCGVHRTEIVVSPSACAPRRVSRTQTPPLSYSLPGQPALDVTPGATDNTKLEKETGGKIHRRRPGHVRICLTLREQSIAFGAELYSHLSPLSVRVSPR